MCAVTRCQVLLQDLLLPMSSPMLMLLLLLLSSLSLLRQPARAPYRRLMNISFDGDV